MTQPFYQTHVPDSQPAHWEDPVYKSLLLSNYSRTLRSLLHSVHCEYYNPGGEKEPWEMRIHLWAGRFVQHPQVPEHFFEGCSSEAVPVFYHGSPITQPVSLLLRNFKNRYIQRVWQNICSYWGSCCVIGSWLLTVGWYILKIMHVRRAINLSKNYFKYRAASELQPHLPNQPPYKRDHEDNIHSCFIQKN